MTYTELNGFILYGFETKERRKFFLDLCSVPRIGGSLTLKILSQIGYDHFRKLVLDEDIKLLTKINGVGKKGAVTIIKKLKKTYQ